jgi:hypothetical protein
VLKKVVLMSIIFCLVAQTALAAGPTVVTPQQPWRYALKTFAEGLRVRVTVNPVRKVAMLLRFADERMKELEALSESDPEAFMEKVLARHDQMVERAQTIISNKDNLPEQIVADLVAAQLKALEVATEMAKDAKDPAIAEKRLSMLKARQELTLAMIEKNAEKIAENQIRLAETVLNNAAETRSRIEQGEGLEVIKERHAQIMRRAQERRDAWLKNRREK